MAFRFASSCKFTNTYGAAKRAESSGSTVRHFRSVPFFPRWFYTPSTAGHLSIANDGLAGARGDAGSESHTTSGRSRGIRMNCRHVVLMDLNPCICSNGTCQNLACLIESALECIVLLHPFSQLHEQLPFKPNLVVIRYSSARSWGDTFSAVRSQWPHVALLGIICGEATSPKVILDSVDRLDDFLCCPARDIDLIPRIHRLLYVDNQAASSAVAREIKKKFQLESLVGENEMLMEVIAKIPCVAQTDATVLI